jgi:hypothetical protein
MVLWTVRWEAGTHERWSRTLKSKLDQGVHQGLSPLRSDGSRDGQAGPCKRWPKMIKGKELKEAKGSSQKQA